MPRKTFYTKKKFWRKFLKEKSVDVKNTDRHANDNNQKNFVLIWNAIKNNKNQKPYSGLTERQIKIKLIKKQPQSFLIFKA